MGESNLAIQIDPEDLRAKIIPIFEEVLDQQFNEETIKSLVDKNPKLVEALKGVKTREVIIGDVPEEKMKDKEITFSQFLGDIRRASGGYADVFGGKLRYLRPEHLVKGESGINPDMLPAGMKKDLYEGTGTAGGYLVPTEENRELINVAAETFSVIPGLCRQVPMRTNQITFPTLTSGLTAYLIPEATDTAGKTTAGDYQAYGEKIRSDIVLGQMTIIAYVCAVKVVVSNQLLDDSDPEIDMILRALFSETLGDAWDTACLQGAGTALDPITGLNGLITTNALLAGAQFDFDDIVDLVFAPLHQDAKSQVQIIGNTYAEQVLLKVKDDDGQYLYKAPISDAAVPTVWGRPYHRDGNLPTNLGAQANQTRLFAGDFKRHGYTGYRMGMIVRTNPYGEPYFSYNQTAFLAEMRVGFTVDAEKYFSVMNNVPTT